MSEDARREANGHVMLTARFMWIVGVLFEVIGVGLIVHGLVSTFDMYLYSIVRVCPWATPLGFWLLFVGLALQGIVVFVGPP